jgi:small subunit ribosomal protein S2
MAVVTMRQLLEAGVHFGHQTRRWNPKMKRFIFGERNGIYIIDLNQTLQRVDVAYSFVRDLVANGGSVLFIGTKKQSQDPIARSAQLCGMPYVNERWLGGMLTNFSTIALRVKKMQEYERMRSAGDFEAMPKKEALILTRELEKLERNLGGIRDMNRLPEAVFIIDIKKEHIAVSEANKMGIPIVAVVDTNCDPDLVTYPIPGNDDAIRSGTLMCRVIQEGVEEGQFVASRRGIGSGPAAGGPAWPAFEPPPAATQPARSFAPARPAPTGPPPTGPAPTGPAPTGAPQTQAPPTQAPQYAAAPAVSGRPPEPVAATPRPEAGRVEVFEAPASGAEPATAAATAAPAPAAPVTPAPAAREETAVQPEPAMPSATPGAEAAEAANGTPGAENQPVATTAAAETTPAGAGRDPSATTAATEGPEGAAEVAATPENYS